MSENERDLGRGVTLVYATDEKAAEIAEALTMAGVTKKIATEKKTVVGSTQETEEGIEVVITEEHPFRPEE